MLRNWTISGLDALLFDLDGVLVNSVAAIEECMRRWAAERGLDGDRVVALAHGRRDADLVRLVAPRLDVDTEVARIAELDFEVMDTLTAVTGAADLLGTLPPSSWAIVTSGTPPIARARLAAVGLPEPSLVITAADVAHGKPDPEGYLLAAEKLGVPPERCAVFEDAPVGLGAATAAGMRCVGVGVGMAVSSPALDAWVDDLSGVRAEAGRSGITLAGSWATAPVGMT